MPKKKISKPREVTRRQLSHWQRESRLQRFTMIGGAIIIVAVLAIVGTGVFMNKFKPYQATVIKADNKEYSLGYYIDMLAYEAKTTYQTVRQFIGLGQYMGYIADTIAQRIQDNQFRVQEAAKQYQITVSDDEVKQEIKKQNISGNGATTDAIRAQMLETKLNEHFDKQIVPASVEQKLVEAMFLESQTQVNAVQERLKSRETFKDVASEVSLESVSKDKEGDFGYVPQGILPNMLNNPSNTTLNDKVFSQDIKPDTLVSVEDKELSKNVGYWLVEITDKPVSTPASTPAPTSTSLPASKVHILAMLLGSEEQALELKAKLEAGGEGNDFATLAKANSQDGDASSNSGDFGLLSAEDVKSKLGEAVAALVFPENSVTTLQTNKVSAPVQDTSQTTKGGFWLLRVSASENRTLDGNNRTAYVRNKLNEWENQVWNDNKDKAETLLTQEQKSFAIAEAQKR